jgi:tetratricopeptide (TPR) repeat protein
MRAMTTRRFFQRSSDLLVSGILLLVVSGTIFTQGTFASPQEDEHAGHVMVGWIPEEILNRPVTLRTGIGPYHEKVTTSSAAAQKFYDQGVAYLHNYVWIEAARSFHQALRTDPKMAMAYLGLSYAYSPMDYAAARAALEKAQSLSAGLDDRERRRIGIRQAQLEAMADTGNPSKMLAFRQSLDGALAAYPDDVELLLLRGHAEEPTPFGDGQGCVASAIPYYQRALAIAADNFAAHHFLTHCYENQGRFTEALEEARIYSQAAPQIPHAQHMFGHELRCVGRTEEAIQFFVNAEALENAYYRRENIPASLDWHHAHNLSLMASAYQYEGQLHLAERYFAEERELTPFTEYAAFNRKDWPEFLLNRGDFTRALEASRQMARSPSMLARAAGHCLAGTALIALHRMGEAEAELNAAQMDSRGLNRADAAAASPYLDLLKLAIMLGRGSLSDAPALLQRIGQYSRRATSADAWSQGLFRVEVMANLSRETGHWEIAEELAGLMLAVDPYYGGSHYAMALAAGHRGDRAATTREFGAAARYWNHADPDFRPMLEIKKTSSNPSGATPKTVLP